MGDRLGKERDSAIFSKQSDPTDRSKSSSVYPGHARERWQRGLVRFFSTFPVLLAVTLTHRLIALKTLYKARDFGGLYNRYDDFQPVRAFLEQTSQSTLNGVRADILFCLIGAALLSFLPRFFIVIFLTLLSLFYSANVESIQYNMAALDISLFNLGADGTFLRAQITPNFLMNTAIFLGVAAISIGALKSATVRKASMVVSSLSAGLLIFSTSSSDFSQPQWLEQHPLLFDVNRDLLQTRDQVFSASPLSQVTDIPSVNPEHNLLVVYMEGLSQISLDRGEMSFLKGLSEQHVDFSRYFGHQLITANGLYVSLTGDLPRFIDPTLRWDEVELTDPAAAIALPRLLKAEGYQTLFIQSAYLSYMSKDRVLPILGFDTVIGAEHHPENQTRYRWGIDDRDLVQNTLDQIDKLDSDRPWMVGVLTSGTHAPYSVKPEFLIDEGSARYRAMRYLDLAISDLFKGLEDRGLLDDTVVVLTADESREFSGGDPLEDDVALAWLPLIVVSPDRKPSTVSAYVTNAQLPKLLLEFLNPNSRLPEIPSLDTLILGNIISSRLLWYDIEAATIYACQTTSFACGIYERVTDITDLSDVVPVGRAIFPNLQRLIQSHE